MQWTKYPLLQDWVPATSRRLPLNGQYVARVSATTAEGKSKSKIIHGFNTSTLKGAGIRVYEYADKETINLYKNQLEFLFWSCKDIKEFIQEAGLNEATVLKHIETITRTAQTSDLSFIIFSFFVL